MAHSCPECGVTCHCRGDIDDLVLEGTPEERACICCPIDGIHDDEADPPFDEMDDPMGDGYWGDETEEAAA